MYPQGTLPSSHQSVWHRAPLQGSAARGSKLALQDAELMLACRFTFFDVFVDGEERGQDVRAGRAQSAPPPVRSQGREFHGNLARDDATELFRHEARRPPPSESGSETDEEGGVRTPLSAGSIGHPVLCKRPCVHVATGSSCVAGAACDFCHFAHNRASWLDRQHRNTLQAICKVDFLLVTLQLLKKKARDSELSPRRSEALFSILERELQSEDQSNANTVLPSRIVQHLRRSSFAAVAGYAAQKCTEPGRAQVHEALQALRMQSA